jgi:hypothetical protein
VEDFLNIKRAKDKRAKDKSSRSKGRRKKRGGTESSKTAGIQGHDNLKGEVETFENHT